MASNVVFSDSAIRLFLETARELRIPLSKEKIPLFEQYYRELLSWNEKINLTRITDVREVIVNHFLDSLVPERFIAPGASIADIGTGAGFPGLPLKIIRPDLVVTLIDSSFKKVAFLRHVVRTLGLTGVDVRQVRIEKRKSRAPEFMFGIGRAVSALPAFLAMARRAVVVGGSIVAMRGAQFQEELEGVKKMLPELNLSVRVVSRVVLPVTEVKRGIIIFRVER